MASKFPLSPDQQSVVDSRDQNILVSAAAGSGKTRVLTERIVGRVTDSVNPVDIDRILVLTFTNAAAKEMKERISAAILERIAEDPTDPHLEKQATLIHNAQITTIDSFCLYVLKNNFHKIGADPSFRVMSEGEKKLLMAETMDALIARNYAEKNEDFHHLVDCYSKKNNDDSLENSIYGLFNYSMSYPWPEDWLNERLLDYSYETAEDLSGSALLRDIYALIGKKFKNIYKLLDMGIRLSQSDEALNAYVDTLNKDREMFDSLFGLLDSDKAFDEVRELFNAVSFARLPNTKGADDSVKAQVQNLRKAVKAEIDSINKAFFYDTADNMVKAMKVARRTVNKLVELTIDFAEDFKEAKKDRGVIDFSDMEHMAVEILVKKNEDGTYGYTDVAKMYRDYFAEVMCDEYQDSNLVQEIILKSISRPEGQKGGNRFMVGDVKQSIYSFRMARPEIFTGKMKDYVKDPEAPDRLITLKNNYRSRDGVIDSVNALFENIMTLDTGGVEYDDDARLYRQGAYTPDTPDNITEVMLVASEAKSTASREKEARMIVRRIRELVGKFPVSGKDGALRPAGYGDMALLFRSPNKWSGIISHAFEEAGIPYIMEGVGDFYEAREIRDVLSFLTVVDNPLSDVSLYAAMTSFFGGFTDEELARIKTGASGYYFFDRVKAYAGEHPEDEKLVRFLNLLGRYRDMVENEPIDSLLVKLYDETGYRHVTAALPDGRQRLANLELLLTKASDYAKSSFKGLFHFLRFVELMKKTDTEEGEAGLSSEGADAVRIMSIHKSKGLEFPICFVGGISEAFNNMDARSAFASNMDAGIGAYAIDPVNRIKHRTLRQSYVAGRIKADNLSEEIRILYVAITRAREKLILTGSVRDPEEWFAKEASGKDLSYADLMEESVNKHKNIYFKAVTFDEESLEDAEVAETVDKAAIRAELESGLPGDGEVAERLRTRFSFTYPKAYPVGMGIKTTVSKLKLAAMEREEDVKELFTEEETTEYIPKFAGGADEIKGTDRGTAYHTVMQVLEYGPFMELSTDVDLKNEFDRQTGDLMAAGKLSGEVLSKVSFGKVLSFLKSAPAREMGEAEKEGNLFKEQPFVISVPASSVDPSFPETETMLVQGVIDVYYIKDGEAVILDYKTDRVEEGSELVKRYETQLDYYAMAIEKITGRKVGKKVIYSFGLGEVILV